MYRLKKNEPNFEIVDGPMAGRRYEHGKSYTKAPAGYRRRFKRIKAALTEKIIKPEKSGKKQVL